MLAKQQQHRLSRAFIWLTGIALIAGLVIVPDIQTSSAATKEPAFEVTVQEQGEVALDQSVVGVGPNDAALTPLAPNKTYTATKGDLVAVNESGKAVISFADAVRVHIFKQTKIQIEGTSDPITHSVGITGSINSDKPFVYQLQLILGTLFGSKLDTAANSKVVVHITTPNVSDINPSGTQFWVYYDEGDPAGDNAVTWVIVQKGSVTVTPSGGKPVVVKTGQHAAFLGKKTPKVFDPVSIGQDFNIGLPSITELTNGAVIGNNRAEVGSFAVLDAQAYIVPIVQPCYEQLSFAGRISAIGSGTATYHWESDAGWRTPDATVSFTASYSMTYPYQFLQPQEQDVNMPLPPFTIPQAGAGWVRLVVTKQEPTNSGRGLFSVAQAGGTPDRGTLVSNAVHYSAKFSKACPDPNSPIPHPKPPPPSAHIGCPASVPVSASIVARGGAASFVWSINGRVVKRGRVGTGARAIVLSVPLARLGKATVQLTVFGIGGRATARRTFKLSCQ